MLIQLRHLCVPILLQGQQLPEWGCEGVVSPVVEHGLAVGQNVRKGGGGIGCGVLRQRAFRHLMLGRLLGVLCLHVGDNVGKDVPLVLVVLVKRSLSHPQRSGDLAHRDCLVSVLGEQLQCRQ